MYVPPDNPDKLVWSVTPFDHEIVNGAVPSVISNVAVPSLPFTQFVLYTIV